MTHNKSSTEVETRMALKRYQIDYLGLSYAPDPITYGSGKMLDPTSLDTTIC